MIPGPNVEAAVAATLVVERPAAARRARATHRWQVLATALVILGLGAVYYAARRPILPIDDATLYVTGAQALAQGHGYRLIGYVGQPFNTFYPPGYSLFLAPLFWLPLAFPANLGLIQLANLAAYYALLALGAVVLRCCYHASTRETVLALLLAATTPLALLMSTAVMSDTLFGVLGLSSVLAASAGWHASGRRRVGLLAAAAALATLAYYTRSAGLTLVVALAVDALWRLRRGAARSEAALLLLPVALAAPWSAWSALNGGSGYLRHWLDAAPGWSIGVDSPESLAVVALGNLIAGAEVLWTVAPALVHPEILGGAATPLGWLLAGPLYLYAGWQSWRRWRRDGEVVHLFLLIYLLTQLLWPYRVMGRFLWPLAPLLAWYLVDGARRLWTCLRAHGGRRLPRLDRPAIALILLANGLWLAGATRDAFTTGWVGDATVREELVTMRRMADFLTALQPADAPLGTNHLSTTSWWYLYTGRQGVDAVARADAAEPFFVRASLQGDPTEIGYFIYQRPNGSPSGGAEDRPVVEAMLAARGASTTPLYCAREDVLCVYDWRARRP